MEMEKILCDLLKPDNNTIIQATEALRESFKSPNAIPALCNVLQNSQSSEIRQYAAVVLKKRLTKARNWSKLSPEVKNGVKGGILPVLVTETEKSVKQAVVQFIAVIAKHELPKGQWPDLMKMLETLITSETLTDKQLGMFTMSVLTDVALDVFSSQPEQFVFLFNHTFHALDNVNTVLGYYTVLTMTHVLPVCEANPALRQVYSKAIPKIIESFPQLAVTDEERACEVLEIFSEIFASAVPLIVPHLGALLQLCMQIGSNKELPPSLRDKAMLLIGVSCRTKKKSIMKLQLVKPIVEMLFRVMCEPSEEGGDEEDDWFADEDSDSPFQSATQVLGSLSIYLPPQKLVEHVVQCVELGLKEPNIYVNKACFLALATVTEGASECIRNTYLNVFLQHVCAGITNNSSVVRNAALFALGQLSEHLQPEISEHHAVLMPILFEYLANLVRRLEKGKDEPRGLYSMFYAIEATCENLEGKLLPYLPTLMERLLVTIDPKHSVNVQELSLSAVGSIASAVKTDILPYFPTIIEKLKLYLMQQHTEETEVLQVQALQTLATVARVLGPEHFGPLAQETMTLGLNLLKTEDPDLKSAVYTLFGSLAFIMKENSSAFLPTVIEAILQSLKSSEGVVPHYKDEETFPVYEDLSDTADEEDIDHQSDASSEPCDFTVENPYMDEKEEACATLKEIALNAGPMFLPYLENCFQEVLKLTAFPHDDVRKSSFETLAEFCVVYSKINTPIGIAALKTALTVVVEKSVEIIMKDDEYVVVAAALDCITHILKEIGPPVFEIEGHRDNILKCVNDILLSKTECQDKDEEEEDEEEAEQDELLMETAGEVIPSLGKAMPPPDFVAALHSLLPAILPKLSKQSSVSQRSFFIGTLADCMGPAGPELLQREELCHQLLQLYLPLTQDSHHEVRNNAIFGLGELVVTAKQNLYSKYMDILLILSSILSSETHPGVIDNICGALARLITTNVQLIPMDEVFPVFMEKLPLREDFAENEAILKCFASLYQLGHASLRSHITNVIRVCCAIICETQCKEETINMAQELLKNCSRDFPAELTSVMQSLGEEVSTKLSQLLNS